MYRPFGPDVKGPEKVFPHAAANQRPDQKDAGQGPEKTGHRQQAFFPHHPSPITHICPK
jgi:hypothetical protein